MPRFAWFLILLLAAPLRAPAQNWSAHGVVRDHKTNAPISAVPVRLTNPADTTESRVDVTADDGTFNITGLRPHTYRLEAVRIGYAPVEKTVVVTSSPFDLGSLYLDPSALPLKGMLIRGSPPPAVQKADTTEFNAKAVKTNPDAEAGDLIEKMPGITVNNGTVKSNGETVQQILVDGKPYFGQDPAIALHNLPAEVIDKIQVFDKMSDQAEFTGFDDGQSIKTMNLILRPEKRNGDFGKVYSGSSADGRYLAGGNANMLKGETRLSVIGLADNVNQQNFSAQDLLGVLNTSNQRGGAFGGGPNGRRAGGGGRGGGGGFGGGGGGFGGGGGGGFGGGGGQIGSGSFLVGQQNGITSTGSVGANYSGVWWKGLSTNQSYFFNQTSNQNTQRLSQQYVVPVDSVALYSQNSNTPNKNFNNRYNGRFVDTLSAATTVVELPQLYFQHNNSSSAQTGTNLGSAGNLISNAVTDNSGTTSGDNLSNHLIVRHRFARRGRTVSVDLGNGYTLKNGNGTLRSLDDYYQGGAVRDTVNQYTTVHSTSNSVSGRLAYTEPLGETQMLQLSLSPRMTESVSNNRAFVPDSVTHTLTRPDDGLSNSFTSRSTAQDAGLGWLRRQGPMNFMANVTLERSTLSERETLPAVTDVDKTFQDVLPAFFINYNLMHQKNFRLSLNTQTRVPSISQVQNLIDTSNPLSFTSGNPDLKESNVQTILCRYSTTNPASGRSIFLLFSLQRIQNYIANSTLTATRDTYLAPGDTLKAGSQLTRPVNLNGYWAVNSFATYSHPVGRVKSVLSLNSGVTYTRTPGLNNGIENLAGTYTLTQGAVLASNISEKVDFTASYTGNYNIAQNSVAGTQNSNYYSHVGSLKCNLIGPQEIVLRNEVSNSLTSGLGPGYDQDVVLWNIGLGKKLLSNQSVELRLTATDLLNQNRSVNRTVTGTYVQDTENLTLKRYVMFNVTYTMK